MERENKKKAVVESGESTTQKGNARTVEEMDRWNTGPWETL